MIHQYKNSGLNIVMDIESGSVHVVDDIVYDIVHALDAMDSVSDFRKVSDGEVKASDFSELEGYLKFMLSKYNDEDIEEAYNIKVGMFIGEVNKKKRLEELSNPVCSAKNASLA